MADALELLVNGARYRRWTSMSVSAAMDSCSGAFSLSLTEKSDVRDEPWPILPGDACEVRAGDDVLVSGFVEVFRPSFGASDHTINVQGRDRTGDLVDCSVLASEYRKVNVLELARLVCRPFGVSVRADVDVGDRIRCVAVQQGESAWELIERYCRQRKLLAMADGAGGMLITRTGSARGASLEQGLNILSASGALDHSQRFSRYIVRSQAGWSADSDGETEAHVEGEATGGTVKRYRPLLIVGEADGTLASARARAVWEANTRVGKSATADIVVQGWRQPSGAIWRPNLIVPVRSPWLRMDGDMLIREVRYSKDPTGGTVATLSVISPKAYEPEPYVPKPDKQNIWAEALDDE